jgi:hypothetical protein
MYQMDGLIPLLEAMKTGDKHRDFCIDDAIFHIKKATEALTDGIKDPEAWYNTSQTSAKVLAEIFPLLLLTSLSMGS